MARLEDSYFDPQTYANPAAADMLDAFRGMLQPKPAVPEAAGPPNDAPNYSPETSLNAQQDLIARLSRAREEQRYQPGEHLWKLQQSADEQKRTLALSIIEKAKVLGISPEHLAGIISYETGGTFDPWARGPVTREGKGREHRGLIQFGVPERRTYHVTEYSTIPEQMEAARQYLYDRGVRKDMGLLDIYAAVNAGRVGLYNRSDAKNGGAPGTVADKVASKMMADHLAKGRKLLREFGQPVEAFSHPVDPVYPLNVMSQPAPGAAEPPVDGPARYLRSRRDNRP